MPLADRNIIITPNRGASTEPNIVFRGADASSSATITLRVYNTGSVGTLSFEGSSGQLFSMSDTFSGTIFSVNDVSGIPSIEVLDTGQVKLAEYSGFVTILNTTNSTSTSTGVFRVSGGAGIGQDVFIGGKVNVGGTDVISAGSWSGNTIGVNKGGTGATTLTANNVILGNGTSAVQFVAPSTNGNVLTSNGSTWVSSAPGASGATISNDTTTNANTFYPGMTSNATSGAWTSAIVSSTKLYFNPSSGTLNATVFNSLSDITFKQDITEICDSLSIIEKLNGIEFKWKENLEKSSGLIAQEVQPLLPHLVNTAENGTKTLNYSGLIPYLIEAVKELSSRLVTIESKMEK